MPELAMNKRARYDYEILETLEAGLVLTGQEVKSVREGRMILTGAHAVIAKGELVLVGAQIPVYKAAGMLEGYDSKRTRKLLVHKAELAKLFGKLEQKGLTFVPISVYTKGPFIKMSLGLGRGKREYDKRETIKKRDLDREARRSLE
jgi:SsrA-binding protein